VCEKVLTNNIMLHRRHEMCPVSLHFYLLATTHYRVVIRIPDVYHQCFVKLSSSIVDRIGIRLFLRAFIN
jgi:hypothetical protein